MCYMDRKGKAIGVRELRQNASAYLRRVEAGETLEVTSRGRPVALLTPLPERATARDRLIAQGRLMAGRARLRELGPALPRRGHMSVSEALEAEREEGASTARRSRAERRR